MANRLSLATLAVAGAVMSPACGDDAPMLADAGQADAGMAGSDAGFLDCPATQPTFHSIYATILSVDGCSVVGCHGGPAMEAAGALLLSGDPAAVLASVLGDTVNPAAIASFPKRVVPGSPDHSYFYDKVATDMPAGGNRMPVGRNLSDCQIAAIRLWIQNGARND